MKDPVLKPDPATAAQVLATCIAEIERLDIDGTAPFENGDIDRVVKALAAFFDVVPNRSPHDGYGVDDAT